MEANDAVVKTSHFHSMFKFVFVSVMQHPRP